MTFALAVMFDVSCCSGVKRELDCMRKVQDEMKTSVMKVSIVIKVSLVVRVSLVING